MSENKKKLQILIDDPIENPGREFKQNIDRILALEPKDVIDFGINRTTLWNMKEKIKNYDYDKITDRIKIKILSGLKNN